MYDFYVFWGVNVSLFFGTLAISGYFHSLVRDYCQDVINFKRTLPEYKSFMQSNYSNQISRLAIIHTRRRRPIIAIAMILLFVTCINSVWFFWCPALFPLNSLIGGSVFAILGFCIYLLLAFLYPVLKITCTNENPIIVAASFDTIGGD